jgi:two-component system, cell cycle response regulator DivK
MSRDSEAVVLLVQSSRDDAGLMYAEFLRFHGLTPIMASNTAEALAAAPRADVIVTGILLSRDVEGVELITQLRADARTKHIPIVVLTSCASSSMQERAQQAGCDAFLTKPCLPEALLLEVRRHVGSSKRARRSRKHTA